MPRHDQLRLRCKFGRGTQVCSQNLFCPFALIDEQTRFVTERHGLIVSRRAALERVSYVRCISSRGSPLQRGSNEVRKLLLFLLAVPHGALFLVSNN